MLAATATRAASSTATSAVRAMAGEAGENKQQEWQKGMPERRAKSEEIWRKIKDCVMQRLADY